MTSLPSLNPPPKKGLATRALQLYEELLAAGFEPQPQVYRALVAACGEAGPSEGGGTKRVWRILQLCPAVDRNNFVYVVVFVCLWMWVGVRVSVGR